MTKQPPEAEDQNLVVNQLIAEFKQRSDADESLTLEEFISEHPEHAEALQSHMSRANAAKETRDGKIAHDDNLPDSSDDASTRTVVGGTPESETSVTRDLEKGQSSGTSVEVYENFGRYAIQKVLGQGAMGAVYLAKDTQLDRDVALKIPKFGDGNGVDDEELLERFYREARASATIRSPNICPVFDVG